ncbi:hypothetical protein IMG5_083340 [Ichthyophthirius multifiliis]|uniref:tRNA:m(4)X modification enzyme TRM13 n=1 Tax=Ichthyophthirius multifiliis TaxID=5932 RepID=G0QQS5_ICHMU|nr:hypothetical protein IMG5_083340 [Ichthyophthirius multifiliis]EGR32446.1 hypothetical protein IMG5_083340 [Ichthyophthirius multifiliis]|eukprot:XP_004036432.1 hypothetical protein IMG5_083340 [Ichthyophthirius multifiliis]
MEEIQQQKTNQIQKLEHENKYFLDKNCQYYLQKKKKICKFPRTENSQYCHYHIFSVTQVKCPIDPTHYINKDNLEKHVQKCTLKKQQEAQQQNIWFQQGINNKGQQKIEKEKKEEINISLKELYLQKSLILISLIQKIKFNFSKALKIYTQSQKETQFQVENTENYFLEVSSLQNNIQQINDRQKDLHQVLQLNKILKKVNLLDKKSIYIEFGAGKGLLSHTIYQKSKDIQKQEEHSAHVLLEIEPRRNKLDKLHRNNPFFQDLGQIFYILMQIV